MTITYNLDIPDAPNNPSNDQPEMKTNTNSIDDWTAVDHVRFRNSPAGTHNQITLSSKNTPGAQTDPQSVVYSGDGVQSTLAQLYFKNQTSTVPISVIRAFGSFTTAAAPAAPPVFLTQYNVNTPAVTHPTNASYIIPLVANAVANDNVLVLLTQSSPVAPGVLNGYSFTGGVLTINTLPSAGFIINFVIIQI